MATDENHAPPPPPPAATVFNEEDIVDADDEPEEDEEDDTEEEEDDAIDDEEEEEEEKEPPLGGEDLNSTNSVTVAVPPPQIPIVDAASILPDIAAILPPVEPIQLAAQQPEERKLFQRLWTDEDEIGLLQGFLDYSTQRGTSQNNPHDTALFYDQIKSKLQLDFNKNQLVEKLRRLKKKYRNVLARMSSGKEVSFKSPHDQATFEIASKIWGSAQNSSKDHQNLQINQIQIDDDMPPPLSNPHHSHTSNFNHSSSANLNLNFAGGSSFNGGGGGVGYGNHQQHHDDRVGAMEEREAGVVVVGQRSKKRSRVKMEEIYNNSSALNSNAGQGSGSQGTVEKPAARSRPLFREMLGNVERFGGRGFGEGIVSPVPLSFAGPANLFGGVENADERWRKQQIMELEVYSKRLELVQEHIRLTLEQLRSAGS